MLTVVGELFVKPLLKLIFYVDFLNPSFIQYTFRLLVDKLQQNV